MLDHITFFFVYNSPSLNNGRKDSCFTFNGEKITRSENFKKLGRVSLNGEYFSAILFLKKKNQNKRDNAITLNTEKNTFYSLLHYTLYNSSYKLLSPYESISSS